MAKDKLTFEDFRPGPFGSFGPHVVTREEIIAFAAEFDPQPMHLDEEAARTTMLGEIVGSGWHLCALMTSMAHDGFLKDAALTIAPGVDEVRWLAPLRPGDALTLRATVTNVRPLRSRPDYGLVLFHFAMLDGANVTLMTCDMPVMVLRRGASAAAGTVKGGAA